MLYARKYAIKLWTFTMRRMYLYRMKYSGTSPRLVCDLVACDAFDFELLGRWKMPLVQSFKLLLEASCAERGNLQSDGARIHQELSSPFSG